MCLGGLVTLQAKRIKVFTMTGAGRGENGGAKAGSLRLGVSPLGLFGQVETLFCCSHVADELYCPTVRVDRVRLF